MSNKGFMFLLLLASSIVALGVNESYGATPPSKGSKRASGAHADNTSANGNGPQGLGNSLPTTPPLQNGPTQLPTAHDAPTTGNSGGNGGGNAAGLGGAIGAAGRMGSTMGGGNMGGAGGGTVGQVVSAVNAIVNLGNLSWTIIQANEPSDNASVASANALPQGVTGWQQLTGWSEPVLVDYTKTFAGVFSSAAVTISYRVHYTYGGTLDGKGKYLMDISVEPVDIHVGWGYKVNFTAAVPNVINIGTNEEPIAAAELLLDIKVSSAFKNDEISMDYYITGDGKMKDLTAGDEPSQQP